MRHITPAATSTIEAEADPPVGAFQFLVERAREFIEFQGGAVPEELLIAHVFGTARTPETWRTLFESVIQHAPDLRKRFDGTWGFLDAPAMQNLLLGDFVAVDVETTGLKAITHRIIEVGLIRYADSQQIGSLSILCNPERRLPAYISKLTGIHDDDLATAVSFGEIAGRISAFIGSSLIVGHNVEFDIRFLNAELKRAGHQSLVNERIDTMALAMHLLTHVRRPSLDKVAKALGLAPKRIHRALDDAEIAARCAILLLKLAQDNGITSLDELRRAASTRVSRPRDNVGRARAVLDTSHVQNVPRCPGVYVMKDANDRILYIGKAKNLRDRVSSYYAQPLGYTRKMDGLIESIAHIDTESTGTELEALILEAQLIRRYQPRFNSSLRAHEQYPYIRVTMSSPWPRICLALHARDDGDRYFGPYRNRRAAKQAVELLNTFLPLRTCPRSFKTARSYGSPCLRLDLHQCLGPCVGRANRGDYLAAIKLALDFLQGDDRVLVDAIHHDLEEAAAQQDFERARQLRNGIRLLQSISAAGRRLRSAEAQGHIALILPSHDDLVVNVAIIAAGRIWSISQATRDEEPAAFAARLARSYVRLAQHGDPVIDHTSLDDTLIVTRWLDKNAGHPGIVMPDQERGWDWPEVASRALSLTYQDFTNWAGDRIDDVQSLEPDGGEINSERPLLPPSFDPSIISSGKGGEVTP